MRARTLRTAFGSAAAVVLMATLPLTAGAAPPKGGFKTELPPMLLLGPNAPANTEITQLLTVGDMIGGYRFEAIPDGISVKPAGNGGAHVFVNHETSKVPFPYSVAVTAGTADSLNDFDNSQLSRLMLRKHPQGDYGFLNASMVIGTDLGYHRFCSNFLAVSDGFEDRPLLFTNEEGIDWVLEDGAVGWTNASSLEGAAGARQIGVVVAYDPATGASQPIWGMGRHNHENSVAVPGYGFPFLLSGDDSFNQNEPQSQLYAYKADNADAVWADEGDLWAFVADDTDLNDYYDFRPDGTRVDGSTGPVTGHFIQVPRDIATGKDADGNDVTSADFDYPLPPDNGTWQRRPGANPSPPVTSPGIDGPQWVLEHWGDLNGVFQFLRIEDIAYDKRPGMSNVVYLADSGRGLADTAPLGVAPAPIAPFRSTNGRVWKMVLGSDPTVVTSLSILIEGDDNFVKTVTEVHQPDNLETTQNGLYITEDPGSSQAFSLAQQGTDSGRATTARLWQYKFSDSSLNRIFKIDQTADEGPTDKDLPLNGTAGSWGTWETTGIIDVSSIFGPGKFLIAVQAHTLFVEIDTTTAPSNVGAAGPDWTWKREGGQLLLVTIPGG